MTNFEKVGLFMKTFGQEVKTNASFSSEKINLLRVNLDKCFDEVQKSNMSKLGKDDKPIYNEAGKVMKGPNYFKPDLSKFLK